MILIHQRRFALVLLAILTLTSTGSLAQDLELIPEDECIFELDLPEGADVEIDRDSHGRQRRFNFKPLQPDRYHSKKCTIRFPSGLEQDYTLLVKGGKQIRLALADPGAAKLELVLQSGSCQAESAPRFVLGGDNVLIETTANIGHLWSTSTGRVLRSYDFGKLYCHCSSGHIPRETVWKRILRESFS